MINYNELDKYYTGLGIPVEGNAGGVFLELGDDFRTLFYKLNDDLYIDVNNGFLAQVMRKGTPVTLGELVDESSLTQVATRKDIKDNTSFVRRLTFDPSKYNRR